MMFERVLIAEDHESSNISVRKTLEDLGIEIAHYVFYCDDALTWIQKARQNDEPYDLLITDLSFEEDHNKQRITGGTELIKAVRQAQPNLKILVFSAENKAAVIDALYDELGINAYVRKARNDAQELKLAINTIYKSSKYISANLRQNIKAKNAYEFADVDIAIISLLSQGIPQKNIPFHLQEKGISPSGLSSVEKRLNLMREALEFSKNEQLVVYCKDFGLI
ncbi:response regulator [Pedobacter sp.]|jgi:two-component system capsular synthesis response regulator RcsB|uniref:response regulator n=1 Tax=Pedobacter sp. TaxID=1411316 RepID=UPI002BA94F6F|nr:response regulator [Pedobacter sp.]HWW37902.1 response regulator [Pedobacter sp.]